MQLSQQEVTKIVLVAEMVGNLSSLSSPLDKKHDWLEEDLDNVKGTILIYGINTIMKCGT